MPAPGFILALCAAAAFSLATILGPRLETSAQPQGKSLLTVLMGDGRRLFANHFFAKADTYFHSGAYPSIFDQPATSGEITQKLTTGEEGHDHAHDHDHDHDGDGHGDAHAAKYEGKALDWLDRFGRNFYPSEHTHLDEGGANGSVSTNGGVSPQAREILPWLKLAAELDPNRIESYTVAAYWLRLMKKNAEAEQFLREGWTANPDSYAILFELGRIYDEDKKDAFRARNLWEVALRKWREQESGKKEPDTVMYGQIIGHLARLEGKEENSAAAIRYLELLLEISPDPAQIRKRIEEVKSGKTKW